MSRSVDNRTLNWCTVSGRDVCLCGNVAATPCRSVSQPIIHSHFHRLHSLLGCLSVCVPRSCHHRTKTQVGCFVLIVQRIASTLVLREQSTTCTDGGAGSAVVGCYPWRLVVNSLRQGVIHRCLFFAPSMLNFGALVLQTMLSGC